MGEINKKMVTGWYGGCTDAGLVCEDLVLSDLLETRYNIEMIHTVADMGHAWSVPWTPGTKEAEDTTEKYPQGPADYDKEHNPMFDRLKCGTAYVIISNNIPYDIPGFFVSHDLKQDESVKALHTNACCDTDSLIKDSEEVPDANEDWINIPVSPTVKGTGAGDLPLEELIEIIGEEGGAGDHDRLVDKGYGSLQMDFWSHIGDEVASVGSGPMSCINTDTWVHIAVIRNSNAASMYVNGVLTGTTLSVPEYINSRARHMASAATAVDILLGATSAANFKLDNGFNGEITNIGIWDRTLTSNEVSVVYNKGERLTSENWINSLQPPEANLVDGLLYYNTFSSDSEWDSDWSGFGEEVQIGGESLVTEPLRTGSELTKPVPNTKGPGYIRRINNQDNSYMANYYTKYPYDKNTLQDPAANGTIKRFAFKLTPSEILEDTVLSTSAGSSWSFSLWAKKHGSSISSFSFSKISDNVNYPMKKLDIDYNNVSAIISRYYPFPGERNFMLGWRGEPGEMPSNSIEPCPTKATTPPGDGGTDPGEQPSTGAKIIIESVSVKGDTSKKDITLRVSILESYDHWHFQIDNTQEVMVLSGSKEATIYGIDLSQGTHTISVFSIKVYGEEHRKIAEASTSFIVSKPITEGACPTDFAYGITHPSVIRVYDDIKFNWRLGNEKNSETLTIFHRLKRADGSWDHPSYTWTGHSSLRSDSRWEMLAPWTPPFTTFTYKPTPGLNGEGKGSGGYNEYGNIRPGDTVVFHFTCADAYVDGEYIPVPDRSFYTAEVEVRDISLPLQIHECELAGYNFDAGAVVGGGKISHGSPVVVLWKTMSPNGGFVLEGDYYRPTIVKIWRVYWAAILGGKEVPNGTNHAVHQFLTETLIETTVNGSNFSLELKDEAYSSIKVGDTIWASVRSTTNSGNTSWVPTHAQKGLVVVPRNS